MGLDTKYRPESLDQIKGNSDLVTTLTNLLEDKENCPHAFLLHGQTGCGKTTIGRIIATTLGCSLTDYTEVNMAEFRGIDTIRELIAKSNYKPLKGDIKFWVLDEIHKMTGDAANALLKILEEPPRHVYFVLCTTEPQKLLETIKGRCSIFQVKPLDESQMYGLLRRILHKEKVEIEKNVLDIIIRDSLGRPRNAIKILEQVIKADPERRAEIAIQTAEQQNQSIELCRELLKPTNWKGVQKVLNGLKDQEAESIRRVVLGYCQAVLLKGDVRQAGLVLDFFITPFYDSGWPQLVHACYSVCKS